MELRVRNPGFDYMLKSILAFQTPESTDFWSEPLYHFYPQLEKEKVEALAFGEKKEYIRQVMGQVYREQEQTLNQKVVFYKNHWEACKKQIAEALSDAFELDCGSLFNDMTCNISLNLIQPRCLTERTFDIFYLNSEKGMVGSAIHEIIHFVWFYRWHRLFGDSYSEYESPSLKWVLSEMVVEAIMGDPRLSSINPYYPREQGGCIYPYFFEMKAGGRLILDRIEELYRGCGIDDFMRESYRCCTVHEAEIRRQML